MKASWMQNEIRTFDIYKFEFLEYLRKIRIRIRNNKILLSHFCPFWPKNGHIVIQRICSIHYYINCT